MRPVDPREKVAAGGLTAGFDAPPGLDQLLDASNAGRLVLWVDVPNLDVAAEFHLPTMVSGWAYCKAGIERVNVIVDDDLALRARHGLLRPDVADALTDPDAQFAGFTMLLQEGVCPVGDHEIAIVAVSKDGQAVGKRGRVTIVSSPEEDFPSWAPGHLRGGPEARLDGGGERFVPELHGGGVTHAEHEARYAWAAQLVAHREVLDAGCGVGWGTMRLLGGGPKSLVGVDLDEIALASARERADGAAEFLRGDLTALPFESDSFDLIVCFEAIEHVEKPERALDELRRVLRPEGILVVSSPNRGIYPAGNPFHLRELTSDELEAALQERFAQVRMYRQQTHAASLLTDDAGDAIEDPTATIDVALHKVVSGRPGSELYAVALAANTTIPPMQGVAFLAEPLDTKELFELVLALQHRAAVAEAEAKAGHGEVHMAEFRTDQLLALLQETEQARAAAEFWLAEHRNSPSWRITAPLRGGKRAALSRLRGAGALRTSR